jgi:hypothetical protein
MPTSDPAAAAAANLQTALTNWTSGQDPTGANLYAAYKTAVPLIQSECRALYASRRTRREGLIQNVLSTNNVLSGDALAPDNVAKYGEVAEAEALAGRADSLFQSLPAPNVPEVSAFVNQALGVASDLATLQSG